MPRLSTHDYYQRRLLLRNIWQRRRVVFSVLSVHAQQELHRFYQPSEKLTLEEVRAHRGGVRQAEPSLANRAGKHYRRIRELYVSAVTLGVGRRAVLATRDEVPFPSPSSGQGRARAYVVARPEPDLEAGMNAILFDLDQGQGV